MFFLLGIFRPRRPKVKVLSLQRRFRLPAKLKVEDPAQQGVGRKM
jgi:hypothetical protein